MGLLHGRIEPSLFRVRGELYVLTGRDRMADFADHQPVARAQRGLVIEGMLRGDRHAARRIAWSLGRAARGPDDEAWLRALAAEFTALLEHGSLMLLQRRHEPRVDARPGVANPLEQLERLAPHAPAAPEPIIDKSLLITFCDHHFAPGAELLRVVYLLRALSEQKVTVEITSDNYPGKTVYKRELEDHEKRDGGHVLMWDGRPDGADGEQFVTPLHAKFKLELKHDATYRDDAEFEVLYHSLRIARGPWTSDGERPDESAGADWVQYRLNELGYFAGPVGLDVEDYLARAIIRYKIAHPDFQAAEFGDYDDSIDDALEQALRRGDNPRRWITGAAWSSASATTEISVGTLLDEHGELPGGGPIEQDWLNRPLLPLEAQILLRSKGDAPVWSPAAVGPVRVSWSFAHDDEGASPDEYDEPWLLGDHWVPYTAEGDAARKLVCVQAWADAEQHPQRRGRAGVLFRPSERNANDYRLRATLDFTDQPNAAQLDELHAIAKQGPIAAETGRFTVVWPSHELALRLADERHQPYAARPYELDVADETITGTTDGNGRLCHTISSDIREVTLRLWPDPADPDATFTWTIAVGRLDPLAADDDITGAQLRLKNLGLFAAEPNGEFDDLTRAALSDFQRLLGHDPPSGELDEATRAALTDRHGR